eukprot:gb/GECG01012613.1/.p1 GENE.gb/GECG01012613.1/~~gb/GECG01012613.1/.p1  ORF type:complete len:151 (+),score=5.39 gb/GECG01012613.1/:1-453(+)
MVSTAKESRNPCRKEVQNQFGGAATSLSPLRIIRTVSAYSLPEPWMGGNKRSNTFFLRTRWSLNHQQCVQFFVLSPPRTTSGNCGGPLETKVLLINSTFSQLDRTQTKTPLDGYRLCVCVATVLMLDNGYWIEGKDRTVESWPGCVYCWG